MIFGKAGLENMSHLSVLLCAFLPLFVRALSSSTHSTTFHHARLLPSSLTRNGIAKPVYLNHTIITNPLPTTGSCTGCTYLLDEFEIGWGAVTTHTAATVVIGVHNASNATATLSTVQGSILPPQEGTYVTGTVVTTVVGQTTYTMQVPLVVDFIFLLIGIAVLLQRPASESTMCGRQMYSKSLTAPAASNA